MKQFKVEPAIMKVYEQLIDHGYEAYFVGGCVRDMLMGIPPHDYDITTSALPTQTMACFSDEFKVIPTGIKHGTITVHYQHHAVEITTFRAKEVYDNHRSPSALTFSTSLSEDLKRRDFTMNAMAYNFDCGLIDEHQGIEDLHAGLVRCVNDPFLRFKEDALRILRCVRFAHRFQFEIEAQTKKALIERRYDLQYISIERITSELFAMLTDGKRDLFMLLDKLSLLDVLIKDLADLSDDEKLQLNDQLNTIANHLPLKLAVLLFPIRQSALSLLNRWKVCNALKKYVLSLLDAMNTPLTSSYAIKKCLYEHQNQVEWLYDLFNLKNVIYHEDCTFAASVLGELNNTMLIDRQTLAVNGDDCLQLGYQGKAIREVIDRLIDEIFKGKLINERNVLLEALKEYKK